MAANLGQILDPRNSAVVTSCAGSGKTWMLIARIMRALLAGARPEEILAITFTRKATGEIRERVHEKLKEFETADDTELARLLEEIRAGTDTATLRRARALRRECLLSERDMSIKTFHGWFHTLLRSQPWLPVARPYNDIIENDRLVIEDAWGLLMEKTSREKPTGKALLELLEEHDYALKSIKEVLRNLIDKRMLWMLHTRGVSDPVEQAAAIFEEANGVDFNADPVGDLRRDKGFIECVARVCDAVEAGGTRREQEKYVREELLPDENMTDDDFFTALKQAFLTRLGEPLKMSTAVFQPLHEDGTIDKVHDGIAEAVEVAAGIRAARFNRRALRVAAAWLEEYERFKDDNRQCDNNDLEVDTWKLLTEGSVNAITLQYKMDRTYRHILIDEFQDTSPLQWEVLRTWLDTSKDAGPDHKPPKVFVIGDPKQSIYRFRGGNPLLLGRAREYLEEHYGGQYSSKNETRRCSPIVISLVNQIFGKDRRAKEIMEGFETHSAHNKELPGRIEILPLSFRETPEKREKPGPDIPLRNPLTQPPKDRETSDEEAQAVAERVLEAKRTWQVTKDGVRRPCEWDDIMLLYAQRTNLSQFEKELRALGVPCAVAGRESALQSLECEDVIALMTFIVNPSANLALAQTLRSPIFGITEDELVKIAHRALGHHLWSGLTQSKDKELAGRLLFARDRLRTWRSRYLGEPMPVHDFLSHLYQSGEILERYACAVPDSLQSQVRDNLLRLLHLSLALGRGRHPQLPMFLREIRRHRKQRPSGLNDLPIKGNVALLSIHAAKGLERPFVFVVDAMREQRHFGGKIGAGDLLHDWPKGSDHPTLVALAPSKHKTAKVRKLLERTKNEEMREWFNMLYIAITRASQAVVFSGTASKGRDGRTDAETRWYRFAREATTELMSAGSEAPVDEEGHLCFGDDLTLMESAVPAPAKEKKKRAATREPGGQHQRKTVGKPHKDTDEAELRGKLFHSLMTLRILGVGDPKVAADAVAVRKDVFDDMWERTGEVFEAKVLRRFFDPGESVNRTCETSLLGADGKVRRLDYLVEFEDEIWILDFKTGEIGPRMEKYREQLGTYRDCVAGLRKDKPVRCAIVSERAELIRV